MTEHLHFHVALSLFTFMHGRRKWQPTPVFLPGESQGREAWWAAVYGVAQSRTRLKRLSSMPPSFLFSFLWNTFIYPLTLSLCVSLKLKWVSCRQHILGSFFFKHQCLFIGEPTLFAFRLGIDYKSWLLPSEWLLSGCFLSPLIPFPFVSAYFCKLVAFHRGIVSPFYISCIYSRFLLWLPWSLH